MMQGDINTGLARPTMQIMHSDADESENYEPEDIRDVKGDGNCFFRCISVALYENEDEHKEIRENVVQKIVAEREFYGAYTDKDFEKHVEGMSRSNGSNDSWATEAELIATSNFYDDDVYVYLHKEKNWEWHTYTKDGKCHHERKHIKILSTGSHFKLVRDEGRPCKCGRNETTRTT